MCDSEDRIHNEFGSDVTPCVTQRKYKITYMGNYLLMWNHMGGHVINYLVIILCDK